MPAVKTKEGDSVRTLMSTDKIEGGKLVLYSIYTRDAVTPTVYELGILRRVGFEVLERPKDRGAAFAFYQGFLSGLVHANSNRV